MKISACLAVSCFLSPAFASEPPALRIVRPADGSIVDTGRPTIEVCLDGSDEATRGTFEAVLDGETIAAGFAWSGDCATWTPSAEWHGFGKRHAWSDAPYEMEGWTAELRDGDHAFEASVAAPSGEKIEARASFRVETTRKAASLAVGFPRMSLRGFEGPFAPVNLLEARFGRERAATIAKDEGVLRYTSKALTIAGVSTRLAEAGDAGETETSLWRFLAGSREGYGYRTGDVAFVAPFHGTSVFFSDLDAYDGPFSPADEVLLERFQDSVRVGSAFEGGIAFRVSRSITLDAGYEQMAVYPHWVFWEAAGSGLVHGIALGIADGVSRQVAKRAPRAAPVVSFLLRNGISYAIHHQRRYEVNWPFGGDPGLIYEGYKVSLTFTY